MYKRVIVTISGNEKKGERPYVKIGPWRYTNPSIAKDYALIGHQLVAYCHRRDARIVHGYLAENGEDLGMLVPEHRWLDTRLSLRERAILYRAGVVMRRKERRSAGSDGWIGTRDRGGEGEGRIRPREALNFARREVDDTRAPDPLTPEAPPPPDPFVMSVVKRRRRKFGLDEDVKLSGPILGDSHE